MQRWLMLPVLASLFSVLIACGAAPPPLDDSKPVCPEGSMWDGSQCAKRAEFGSEQGSPAEESAPSSEEQAPPAGE
jgi:hypothetical protein